MTEREYIEAGELAVIRDEIARSGFQRDPLAGDKADQAHVGLNVAIAWPWPAHLEPAYSDFAKRALALDGGLYLYPFSTTHVTVLTAVNFKEHPGPDAAVARDVDDAAAALGAFVLDATSDMAPFALEMGSPVLARAAAFLPMRNATGEVRRLRERALDFCRSTGGILARASAPKSIHSTFLRFREAPLDPPAFQRGFDAIAAGFHPGPVTIDRVLVTLETKPYMREGHVTQSVALIGKPSP